jgi:hypothetical protein
VNPRNEVSRSSSFFLARAVLSECSKAAQEIQVYFTESLAFLSCQTKQRQENPLTSQQDVSRLCRQRTFDSDFFKRKEEEEILVFVVGRELK